MRDDPLHFRVSSFCSSNGCVGVAATLDGVEVAHVGDEESAPLRFTREEWAAFVDGVKAGEFDLE